uniref:Uncharacterized protein n=1 Tax=Siphoviridae sp. ctFmt20 TaxID=2826214 RepID=A0A8S5ND36_9CAUD|nr:MAG TPA: hypothetical protein [Siphoviridae sp. ctFmt20]
MKVNKALFISSLTFFAILVSVLIASFNISGYTMTWPHFATFFVSMLWYGSELNREMNR